MLHISSSCESKSESVLMVLESPPPALICQNNSCVSNWITVFFPNELINPFPFLLRKIYLNQSRSVHCICTYVSMYAAFTCTYNLLWNRKKNTFYNNWLKQSLLSKAFRILTMDLLLCFDPLDRASTICSEYISLCGLFESSNLSQITVCSLHCKSTICKLNHIFAFHIGMNKL